MSLAAQKSGHSWGKIALYFTLFGSLTSQIRPNPPPEDRWNNVCSSCLAGAALSRKEGPKGMAKGCVSYAGITYVFDRLFSSPQNTQETVKP